MAEWSSWPALPRTPENEAVFRRFDAQPFPPRHDGAARDPYWEMGSHPDAVAHVMDKLGAALPPECRYLASGRAVLAHPGSGRVLAMAIGTAYAIWVSGAAHEEAVARGLDPRHRWGNGKETDLAEELGQGWLFGAYRGEESRWLKASFDSLER